MCIYIKSKLKKSEIVKKTTYFHDFNQPNTFDFFFREIKMELTQKVVRLIFTTYLLYIFFDVFFFSFQVFSTLYFILFFQFFTTFFFSKYSILPDLSNFIDFVQFCENKTRDFFSFQANDIFRQLSEGNEEMLNRVTAQLNAAHQGQATQGDQGRGENESNSESFSFSGYFSRLMRSNPEMVGVFSTFEKYIPFVLILVTKQLFDHSTGKNNNHTFLKVQFSSKNNFRIFLNFFQILFL